VRTFLGGEHGEKEYFFQFFFLCGIFFIEK